jgi:hypothetical protein
MAITLIASGEAEAFTHICQLFLRHSWSRRTSSAFFFSARPNGFIRAGCRNLPQGSLSTNKKTKKRKKKREKLLVMNKIII